MGIRGIFGRQDGAAGVEFALLLPLLLVLTFGITEVGRLLLDYHAIEKSVRGATRYLTRVADPAAATEVAKAKSIVLRGSTDTTTPLLLSYFTGTSTTPSAPNSIIVEKRAINNAAGDFRGETTLYAVEVTAIVPFNSVLMSLLGMPDNMPLSVHHEQRFIGN